MTTKTQRDLNLEYWGRVHDMCDAYNKEHGTSIKPYQCVKHFGVRHFGNMWNLKEHPHFDGSNYDLAVAIIDGKPVFVGDVLYSKDKGLERIIKGGSQTIRHIFTNVGSRDLNDLTLTPPKHKRTFELNGRQLPCPLKSEPCADNLNYQTLCNNGKEFYFESCEDKQSWRNAFNIFLEEARAKD